MRLEAPVSRDEASRLRRTERQSRLVRYVEASATESSRTQVLRDLQEAEGVVHEDHAVVPPDRVDPALTGGPAVGAEEVRDELDAHADPVDDEEVLEVPQEEDLRGVGDRRGHRAGLVGR